MKFIFEHRTREYRKKALVGYVISAIILLGALIFSYIYEAGILFYSLFILLIINTAINIHSAVYGAYVELKGDKVIIKRSRFSKPREYKLNNLDCELNDTYLTVNYEENKGYEFNLSYLDRDQKDTLLDIFQLSDSKSYEKQEI